MTDVRDAVAVVTGAAGGMGAAIAKAFADEGRPLLLSDLREESIRAVADRIGDRVPVSMVSGDITDPDYPGQIISALDNRKIGVLAHAAGVSPSMADGKRIFEINFTATKRLVDAVLPVIAADGVVILVASNSGQLFANPVVDAAVRRLLKGQSSLVTKLMLRSPKTAYPLSKRAVQLYAQSMSPAFGKAGARIVSVSPGIIDTEMGRLEQKAEPMMERMINVSALRRMGTASEIASVVAFLASPAASYISGTDILVDGGCISGTYEAGGIMKLRSAREQN